MIGRVFNRLVRPALVFVRDTIGYLAFERRQGVRTSGEVQLEELGLARDDRVQYKPSYWLSLRRALKKRDVNHGDVFIDFGSGMGRVVVQAARYPFKRVIGVELSEELNAIARENVSRARGRPACRDVQLVTSDVLDYEIPDDVTVAYFYNPFLGDTFSTVLVRLIASVDRNPRRLRIIYRNPVEHEAVLATGRARMVKAVRGLRPGREWARSNSVYVYEISQTPDGPDR